MKVWLVWTAAALLSVERIAYILIWRDPATFTSWSTRRAFAIVGGGPVDLLVVLFASFKVSVFYGNKFGHSVSWCRRFPFTWFEHPQYVGTALAIWGFFFAMRFPAPDWIVLPLLESAYYAAGARLERDPV